jgi:hypothetical protein
MRHSLLIFFLVVLACVKAFSQTTLAGAEIQIQDLHKQIIPGNSNIQNQKLADSINERLEIALNFPEAFVYPFDSLKFLGRVSSNDENVRILTWNLPSIDKTNLYFGYVLYKPTKNEIQVFRLNDFNHALSVDELTQQSSETWYGCLIYDIIDIKFSGETWYTLLGYDPGNMFTTRKLIDILWFRDNTPVFGKPIFRTKKTIQNRVFFEYSARAQMTLTWDQRLDMIVSDHLAPSDPAYQGNFRYYGPDFSYDGFKFANGMWEFHENIDVRGR